jgi:hypothetical protein
MDLISFLMTMASVDKLLKLEAQVLGSSTGINYFVRVCRGPELPGAPAKTERPETMGEDQRPSMRTLPSVTRTGFPQVSSTFRSRCGHCAVPESR